MAQHGQGRGAAPPHKRAFDKDAFRREGVDLQEYKLHQEEHPDVGPVDLTSVPAWTPAWTLHRFVNGGEPFGFLCIVDGDRGRPEPLSPEQVQQLQAVPEVAAVMRLSTD